MSDPISDLKHELLAAAARQQRHAATGPRADTSAFTREVGDRRSRWLVLVGGLLVTPALGIGDRLLSLIQGTPRHRSTCRLLPGRATGGRSCS